MIIVCIFVSCILIIKSMYCDLIIKGKYVLPMDDEMSIIKDGMVAVDKNTIIAVGEEKELKSKYKTREIIGAGNGIIMPGLVNAHTHAAMAYFRGLADDLLLDEWLNNHIWPAEAEFVKPDFVRKSSELACLEMIKAGITCFNDMYFFQEITAEISEKAGMRMIAGEGILDFPTPSCKAPDEAVAKTIELIEKFRNNELINIAFAPHSVYTCGENVLLKIKELAKEYDLPVHIHLSETKKEVEDCENKRGRTPAEYLDEIGFLSDRVIAVHSVWLSEKDLEIYKNRGVKAVHCPISNMKLASGVAPIPEMPGKGITAGLGTDGAASNNTLDLFSDMRACALIHKVNKLNPTVLSAREVVRMATINGAKVLNLDKKIGSLEAGKRADIIAINLDKPHLAPVYDPYSHLVYCASARDVEDVIINGKIVMKNREVKTIDEERVLREAVLWNSF